MLSSDGWLKNYFMVRTCIILLEEFQFTIILVKPCWQFSQKMIQVSLVLLVKHFNGETFWKWFSFDWLSFDKIFNVSLCFYQNVLPGVRNNFKTSRRRRLVLSLDTHALPSTIYFCQLLPLNTTTSDFTFSGRSWKVMSAFNFSSGNI